MPVDKRYEDYKNENDTVATNLTTEVSIIKVSNPTQDNDFNPVAYKPYQVYINSGEYPLFRKVYMITTAPKSSVVNSFYMFVTGFAGRRAECPLEDGHPAIPHERARGRAEMTRRDAECENRIKISE